MSDELQPFATSDTPLAAFLMYKKQNFVGLRSEADDPKRKMFVFVKTEETEPLVLEYTTGDPDIKLKRYTSCLKRVRVILREGENV